MANEAFEVKINLHGNVVHCPPLSYSQLPHPIPLATDWKQVLVKDQGVKG